MRRRRVLAAAVLLATALAVGLVARERTKAPQVADGADRAAGTGPSEGPVLAPASRRAEGAPEREGGPAAAEHDTTLAARDAAGKPVEGVFVEVIEDRDAPPVAAGTTDAGGRVRVALRAGTYRARVRHARFHADVAPFHVPAAGAVPVRLFAGVSLRVRVRDETGAPVEGARVTQQEFGQGLVTTTGADGLADLSVHGTWEFLVVDRSGFLERREWANQAWKRDPATPLDVRLVRAAPLTVRVSRAGDGAPEAGASVWVSHSKGDARGNTDAEGVVRLEAAPPGVQVTATTPDGRRGTASVEIARLEAADAHVTVSAGRTVLGVAVRADGATAAGAVVLRRDEGSTWGSTWVEATRTDASGRFRLDRVREDKDSVEVRVRGAGWSGPDEDADLGDGDVAADAPLRVVLSPTDALAGRVLGPDGRPVAGATVVVSSATSAPLSLRPLEATTDREGRYHIEDVPRWEHLAVIAETNALGVQETDDTLPTAVDGVVAVPDLVLPGTFTLDVPVVDEAHRPVPVAWLIVRQRVRTQGEKQWWRTASDGRFHALEGLSRDGVGVEVTAPGFLQGVLRVDATTERIVVDRACRVRGRLVAEDGSPVAGKKVEILAKHVLSTLEGNAAAATTDARGAFEAGGIRRGRYDVFVEGGGNAVVSVTRDEQDLGDVAVAGARK